MAQPLELRLFPALWKSAAGQTRRFGWVASDGIAPGNLSQGQGSYSDILARLEERRTGLGAFVTMEAVYAPGTRPWTFNFTGPPS